MDLLEAAKDKWKSVQDLSNTTTNVTLLLFMALAISWVSMWSHVNNYRGTIAYYKWTRNSKQYRLQAAAKQKQLNAAVQGRLLFLAYEKLRNDCVKRKTLIATAQGRLLQQEAIARCEDEEKERRGADRLSHGHSFERLNELPEPALPEGQRQSVPDATDLLKQHSRDWQGPFIAEAIRIESSSLLTERQHAAEQLQSKRALAETTTFKLLGLDFEINGFWAWNVWLLFFFAGILHIWLVRRALIRRCRTIGKWLCTPGRPSGQEVRAMKASLPLWMRPLPKDERWIRLLGSSVRSDISNDWLAALATIAMFTCLALAAMAVWMSVISTSIIRTEGRNVTEGWAHEIVLISLCGCILGILLNWISIPFPAGSYSRQQKHNQSIEIAGRRTWLLGALAICGSFVLYRRSVNKFLVETLLLQSPRFAKSANSRHPRFKTKQDNPPLKQGFYKDLAGTIHYVPHEERSKSIQRLNTTVNPWSGPFDADNLSSVHPSAILPFVRAGVAETLKGLGHHKVVKRGEERFMTSETRAVQERRVLLNTPKNQALFLDAFSLTQAAIDRDMSWRKHRNALPNVQLFDLLANIAMSANSPRLMAVVIENFSALNLGDRKFVPSKKSALEESSKKPGPQEKEHLRHSRHTRKKAKKDFWERRLARLYCYKQDRIRPEPRKGQQHQRLPVVTQIPGKWTSWLHSRASDREVAANDVHRVRNRLLRFCKLIGRDARRCGRIHRKDVVQSRICEPV